MEVQPEKTKLGWKNTFRLKCLKEDKFINFKQSESKALSLIKIV